MHIASPKQPEPDAGTDETSWREYRSKAWLWVAVTQVATVFTIAETRGAKVIREMLGENYHRVLTSDRWTAYTWIKRRQLCWTHLRRDFQAMIDRENDGTERVLRQAVLWRKSSGGTDSEAGSRFVERMLSVVATCRQQNRNVLELLTA